ncbi:MAG: bifunctional (p)ppGpp synthetase/guanosine-3',5'-bis(diphosphate) 3'-pyrophosphohydrolase, partial [Fimbriimonadales bacterium]
IIRKSAENLRKLFVSVSEDLRVLLIKLADRLHNMQTLDSMPRDKQIQIARETLMIYAPLAHRLGLWTIKSQLDDLSFKYLYPQEYREISQKVAQTRAERQMEVQELIRKLKERLWEREIRAEVTGRPKHLWSIYNKMKQQKIDFEQIYDLIALRVLVNTVEECYMVLGIVHDLWRPVPTMFYDYIAAPKPNGYQSLHTKVIGPSERTLEIQIRTWRMHQIAEYGVAAHWRYKEGENLRADQKPIQMPDLQGQLRDLTDSKSHRQFLSDVFSDLSPDQVFVFSPKGDVYDLPKGSTPIDFAYRVHTEVGNRCVGALVNGQIVPLNYELRTGDVVEIQTRPNAQPSYDWLGIARTSSARSKIRNYLRQSRRAEFVRMGKEILERELARNTPLQNAFREQLPEVLKAMNMRTEEDLYASIGESLTSVQAVLQRLRPTQGASPTPSPPFTPTGREIRSMQIEDADGYLTQRANCCYPLPGDELRGFVSRGRGIIVHRASCPNLRKLEDSEPERVMNIEWVRRNDKVYPAGLIIETEDRPGVMADISATLAGMQINIGKISVERKKAHIAQIFMTIEVHSAQELRTATQKLGGIDSVISVMRVMSEKNSRGRN